MFIDRDEIIRQSNYGDALSQLDSEQFEEYENRADNYITMITNKDYSKTNDSILQQALKTATWRLIDYLFYFDNEDVEDKEKRYSGIKSENIGDYSYTKQDQASDDIGLGVTGDKELDEIIKSLTVEPRAPLMFRTSKPNKRGGRNVF